MILALLRLFRPHYSLPLTFGFIVIVSYATAADFSGIEKSLTLSSLSLFFIISSAYALNDLCDIETDKINNPSRPIPSGKISSQVASRSGLICFHIGMLFAITASLSFFFVILIVAAALIFYNRCSKRLGYFKAPLVALIATSLYPMAFALAFSKINFTAASTKSLYIFPVWFFIIATAYEIFKDIRDIEGDSLTGPSSRWSIQTARGLTVIAAFIALLPSLLGFCHLIYSLSAIVTFILAITTCFSPAKTAIKLIYTNVFIIAAFSYLELLILQHYTSG